jgi:hypothetical protein
MTCVVDGKRIILKDVNQLDFSNLNLGGLKCEKLEGRKLIGLRYEHQQLGDVNQTVWKLSEFNLDTLIESTTDIQIDDAFGWALKRAPVSFFSLFLNYLFLE